MSMLLVAAIVRSNYFHESDKECGRATYSKFDGSGKGT
jgi:hypothetical protein